MSYLIAVTGKGGVGKTTLSALMIRELIARGLGPVLAIDADPNSCLDGALGVKATNTVGRAREEVRESASNGVSNGAVSGISKTELLQMKIQESLVEAKDFDLIAMGRPEGAGCYCYANNVLKSVITKLAGQYPYVVLDNEAGLENLSRRIVQRVDALVLCSDASKAGLDTLARLYELAIEMKVTYAKLLLVVNRVRGDKKPAALDEIRERTGASAVFLLPDDDALAMMAENAESLLDAPQGNAVRMRVAELVNSIIEV